METLRGEVYRLPASRRRRERAGHRYAVVVGSDVWSTADENDHPAAPTGQPVSRVKDRSWSMRFKDHVPELAGGVRYQLYRTSAWVLKG